MKTATTVEDTGVSGHTILTSFWLKPIPIRCYDWEATMSNYEAGDAIGFGTTEADAIHDLKQQLWERCETDDIPDEPVTGEQR